MSMHALLDYIVKTEELKSDCAVELLQIIKVTLAYIRHGPEALPLSSRKRCIDLEAMHSKHVFVEMAGDDRIG